MHHIRYIHPILLFTLLTWPTLALAGGGGGGGGTTAVNVPGVAPMALLALALLLATVQTFWHRRCKRP